MIGVLSSHRGECCHTPNSLLMVSAPTHIRGPIPFLTDLLVSGLEELGHRVTLVSCWGRRQEKESLWSKAIQRLRDIALILRESRTDNFDLVYIHTSHDIGTLLRDIPLLTALWLRRTPIVVLLHGSDAEQLESHRRSCLCEPMAVGEVWDSAAADDSPTQQRCRYPGTAWRR
jgi:hypothetical protein